MVVKRIGILDALKADTKVDLLFFMTKKNGQKVRILGRFPLLGELGGQAETVPDVSKGWPNLPPFAKRRKNKWRRQTFLSALGEISPCAWRKSK